MAPPVPAADPVGPPRVLAGGAALAVCPWAEPEAVAARWARAPGTLWLDSGDGADWSYLLASPMDAVGVSEGADPLRDARAALSALTDDVPDAPGRPPFRGGLAGLFGYELGRRLEPSLADRPSPAAGPTLPVLWLGRYRDVLAFDHGRRRLVVLCQPWGDGPGPVARCGALVAAAAGCPPLASPVAPPRAALRPDQAPADYQAQVADVVARIAAGEIFQANLSQRFLATPHPDDTPWALYRRLRRAALPAHGAWLYLGPEQWVASVSPERLVRVSAGVAEASPIKGTRPRSADRAADASALAELLGSEKDRAENTMIVDLLRNDLSAVCEADSVAVPQLCAPLSLPTVHHLVSTVRGRVRAGLGPLDVVSAVFPGGSITGAPKIQAMRVIARHEAARRGPYCGSLGWLSPRGDLDLSIAIRSACSHEGGQVGWGAGGGVVYDSDPGAEELETRHKLRAFARALPAEGAA